jgi:ketosteroid isomerase-like protein
MLEVDMKIRIPLSGLFVALMVLAYAVSALVQTANTNASSNPTADKTKENQAKEDLIQLEKKWAEAGPKGDIGFFDRVSGVDYAIIDDSGELRNKQQELALARNERITTSTVGDMDVRVYGSTAVVVGRFAITGNENGQAFRVSGRFTDVWIQRNGGWQVVSTQNTRTQDDMIAMHVEAGRTALTKIQGEAKSLREILVEKEEDGWKAIKIKDYVAWANLIAEDFVEVDALGVRGKSEEAKALHDINLADYAISDTRALCLGRNVGLVIYKISLRGTYQGKDLPKTLYESSLYVKRGEKWLCLFSEDTEAE